MYQRSSPEARWAEARERIDPSHCRRRPEVSRDQMEVLEAGFVFAINASTSE